MISTNNKIVVNALMGTTILASLLVTSALATPQDSKKPDSKKPTTKTPPKKPATTAGDPAAGKKIYDAQGCAGCHAISGTGGAFGPELTKVGADPKHTAKYLTAYVTDPKAQNPDSKMPAYGDKVKGKDLTNLVAYLSSLKK